MGDGIIAVPRPLTLFWKTKLPVARIIQEFVRFARISVTEGTPNVGQAVPQSMKHRLPGPATRQQPEGYCARHEASVRRDNATGQAVVAKVMMRQKVRDVSTDGDRQGRCSTATERLGPFVRYGLPNTNQPRRSTQRPTTGGTKMVGQLPPDGSAPFLLQQIARRI